MTISSPAPLNPRSSQSSEPFADCGPLGLYAIVDSSAWVARLIDCGVKAIQLRIKQHDNLKLAQEIAQSVRLAREHNIKLFINDHWELAMKHKAYGVHLGQEDLQNADTAKIKQHGLKLGISTHSHAELASALAYQPSYIALGPIYPTTSKIMPWQPQGIARIYDWLNSVDCRLVVIGGIGLNNIDEVLATGVTDIAMITAITQAENPEQVVKLLLQKIVDNRIPV